MRFCQLSESSYFEERKASERDASPQMSQKEIINNQLIGILIKSIKINYSIIINSRQFCVFHTLLCAPFPFSTSLPLCAVHIFRLNSAEQLTSNWIEWPVFLDWCAIIIGFSSSWRKKKKFDPFYCSHGSASQWWTYQARRNNGRLRMSNTNDFKVKSFAEFHRIGTDNSPD